MTGHDSPGLRDEEGEIFSDRVFPAPGRARKGWEPTEWEPDGVMYTGPWHEIRARRPRYLGVVPYVVRFDKP